MATTAIDRTSANQRRRNSVFWDFVERAGWSAGQQFVAVLIASGTAGAVLDLPWALAAAMAVGAAITSVAITAVQYLTNKAGLSFWPDLLTRLGKTFLGSLVGSFGAEALNVLTFDWKQALNVAVLATLGALAKGLLARDGAGTPGGQTPSTLPPTTYWSARGQVPPS